MKISEGAQETHTVMTAQFSRWMVHSSKHIDQLAPRLPLMKPNCLNSLVSSLFSTAFRKLAAKITKSKKVSTSWNFGSGHLILGILKHVLPNLILALQSWPRQNPKLIWTRWAGTMRTICLTCAAIGFTRWWSFHLSWCLFLGLYTRAASSLESMKNKYDFIRSSIWSTFYRNWWVVCSRQWHMLASHLTMIRTLLSRFAML